MPGFGQERDQDGSILQAWKALTSPEQPPVAGMPKKTLGPEEDAPWRCRHDCGCYAIEHDCMLVTDNRKDFPMQKLRLYSVGPAFIQLSS